MTFYPAYGIGHLLTILVHNHCYTTLLVVNDLSVYRQRFLAYCWLFTAWGPPSRHRGRNPNTTCQRRRPPGSSKLYKLSAGRDQVISGLERSRLMTSKLWILVLPRPGERQLGLIGLTPYVEWSNLFTFTLAVCSKLRTVCSFELFVYPTCTCIRTLSFCLLFCPVLSISSFVVFTSFCSVGPICICILYLCSAWVAK